MSTILQPCFESQFIETTTVKLKLAPSSNTDVCGGLSFQQILAGICSGGDATTTNTTTPVVEKESIYVHPLSKRSSSSYSSSSRILSEKSFEMCTENLGSETGTDDVMDINILSSSSYSSSPLPLPSPSPSPREYSWRSSKKLLHSSSRNFPPPLTTISGANSLQVRSHRESGRLVLKAIESPIRHSFLHAERSNGRLTLTLHKHPPHLQNIDTQKENNQEQEEFEEEEENEISYINDQDLEEIDDDDESDSDFVDPNNNNDDDDIHEQEEDEVVYEMGMKKYKRSSRRCNIMNEGHTNTVLCKPLWVATS